MYPFALRTHIPNKTQLAADLWDCNARVLNRIFRIFSTKFSMLRDHPHNESTPQ